MALELLGTAIFYKTFGNIAQNTKASLKATKAAVRERRLDSRKRWKSSLRIPQFYVILHTTAAQKYWRQVFHVTQKVFQNSKKKKKKKKKIVQPYFERLYQRVQMHCGVIRQLHFGQFDSRKASCVLVNYFRFSCMA